MTSGEVMTLAVIEAVDAALDGQPVSDFMESFPIVRKAMDLRAALALLRQERDDRDAALRREWWVNHGCEFAALYGDDGEMQCNATSCRKDFKREPIETLRLHVEQRRLERLRRAIDQGTAPEL